MDDHLARLNSEQLRAVTAVDGPVLVLAGAGSGKTRVLTRRIAHLLHLGVDPRNVLAVTFTNKAAEEMRGRVAELVGEGARHLWVSTFHSTCCRILRKDAERLGYTRRFSIYDDDDQKRLMRGLVQEAGLDVDRVAIDDVLRTIDRYKNRLTTPDEALAQRRAHVGDRTLRLWRAYEDALKAADAMDFNDLIAQAARLFKEDSEALQTWQEKFHYVLVDEYQDTNLAQYDLLRRLTSARRNLAVVGDDDQSIYGFRGADVTNILNFERDFPDATIVRLEQNYRSTGHILSTANAVVQPNSGRLEKSLWTDAEPGARVQHVLAQDPRDEAERVAAMIDEVRRRDDMTWGDFAVIYRTNMLSRPVEQALRRRRIPYRVVGGRRFWERREVRDILGWLRLVANPADDAAFLRAVGAPPRGVGAKTLHSLRATAAQAGVPLLAAARRTAPTGAPEKALAAFTLLVSQLTDLATELPLHELIARVIDATGYHTWIQSDADREEREEHLTSLVQAGILEEDDRSPMERLTAWLDTTSLASDTDDIPKGGEVALMTVHSAKGLEYPVVFVLQMNEDKFPHSRAGDEGIEEERRLAYVAFTRARRRLFLCRTRLTGDEPGTTRGPARPSRFLFGLPGSSVVGDVPDGEPDAARRRGASLPDENRERLASLMRNHHARPAADEREIEDEDELVPGVRLRHVRHGPGTVVRRTPYALVVRFDRGGQRELRDGQGLVRLLER